MAKRYHHAHWGAFTAEVTDGRIVAVEPFAKDPEPSPILQSIPDSVHGRSRVVEPMVRKGWLEKGPGGDRDKRGGDPFVPVSWERALDLVAAELTRVKTSFGNEAIFGGSYGWSSAGRFHHAKSQVQRFLNCYGGFTGQVHTYSLAAGLAILPYCVGTLDACRGPLTDWRAIEAHTKLMVCFGGLPLKNTQVDPGGSGEHGAGPWLHRIHAAGCRFVNISPVRDDMAESLDPEWIPVRPNTDVAFMLGMAHTLWAEGLHDEAFLTRYCVGFERFLPYLTGASDGQPKDPTWASAITGVSAETIAGLARRLADTRSLVNTSWSLQRGDHGEQPFWMTVVLGAMLGQVGLPGGGFALGYGSMGGIGAPRERIPSPALPLGTSQCDSFIPVARIADMLLSPGAPYEFNGEARRYPDIRLVYWCGGNPFHHHQDLNRLVEAFRRPETIIFHEPWWTASARHADIVLPATTTLERNDIGASSNDRFILAMEKAIEPVGGARNDFDIFTDLATRLGIREPFTENRDEIGWLRHIYDIARQQAARRQVVLPSFDEFWAAGHVEVPMPAEPFVFLGGFRADPERHPLGTPTGRLEIFSETINRYAYDDCPGHPVWLEPAEWLGAAAAAEYPLHLVSNQPRTRLHGQMDDGRISLASKVAGREPMWMHPEDAAARGLVDGDVAHVYNRRGAILAGVVVTDVVRPGCVQLATGAWYDPLEPGRVGTLDKHGNANVLTLDRGSSKLSQGPIAHTALVQVERWTESVPAITAFEPPPTASAAE